MREALEAGRAFDRIVIARGRQDTRVEQIVQLARERNISVRFEDRSQLDRLADSKDHQGVVALAAPVLAQTQQTPQEDSSFTPPPLFCIGLTAYAWAGKPSTVLEVQNSP